MKRSYVFGWGDGVGLVLLVAFSWEDRLSGFLKLWDREILQDAGKVTAELAGTHAESEFEKYRIVQDRLFESDLDRMVKQIESAGEDTPGKD